MSADWPDGARALTQIYYLILPSLPLAVIFFGYMARVTRAGMVNIDPMELYANNVSANDLGTSLAASNVIIPSVE